MPAPYGRSGLRIQAEGVSGFEGAFDGRAVAGALKGHVLAEASHVGTYSLNPAVKA